LEKKLATANLSCLEESAPQTPSPPPSPVQTSTSKPGKPIFTAVNFKRVQKHRHPPVSSPKKSLTANRDNPNGVNRNESIHRAKSRSLSDFFSSSESSPINRLLSIICKEKEAEKMMHSTHRNDGGKTKAKPTAATSTVSATTPSSLSETERLESRRRNATVKTGNAQQPNRTAATSSSSTVSTSVSKSVRSSTATSSAKSSDEQQASSTASSNGNKPIRTTKASRLRAAALGEI
jgi:hypothetical protein